MTTKTESKVIGDIVKFEDDAGLQSRELRTVASGQTLVIGQVCRSNGTPIAKVDDVQTITISAGADGGTFELRYGDATTTALAYNISTANLQVALRALHTDLATCVVTGTAGTSYVITTAGIALGSILVVEDLVLDGDVYEATLIVHTTLGVPANPAGSMTALAVAVSDVQTITMSAGTDGGTFALHYRGASTAPLAYNVATADMQTAVRALHADLAASVVTTVGGVGVDYVITTAAKACTDIDIVGDQLLDGAVAEPASIVHTTQGCAAGGDALCIILEDCDASGGAEKALFLTRNATVDESMLTWGTGIVPTDLPTVKAALLAQGIVCALFPRPTYVG